MGTTSPVTFVKNSVGWSIALSVLMIVAGILAIASPLAAGIAINVLVAWLLVFSRMRAFGVCVVHAVRRRVFLGIVAWNHLHFHRRLFACTSSSRLGIPDDSFGDLSIAGVDPGICFGIYPSAASWIRLARIRWHHHSNPRGNDLEDVAIEHGMGHRHAGRDQHAV